MFDEVKNIHYFELPVTLPLSNIVVIKGKNVTSILSNVKSKNIIGHIPSENVAIITMSAWDNLQIINPLQVWVLDSRRFLVDYIEVNSQLAVAAQQGDNSIRWAPVVRSTGQLDEAIRVNFKIKDYLNEVTLRDISLYDDLILLANDHERGLIAGYPKKNTWFAFKLKSFTPDYCHGIELWGDFVYLVLQSEICRISLESLLDVLLTLEEYHPGYHATKERGNSQTVYAVEAPKNVNSYLEFYNIDQIDRWRPSRRSEIKQTQKDKKFINDINTRIIIDLWSGMCNQSGMLFLRTPYDVSAYYMGEDIFLPISRDVSPPFIVPISTGWIEIHKSKMVFASTSLSVVEEAHTKTANIPRD